MSPHSAFEARKQGRIPEVKSYDFDGASALGVPFDRCGAGDGVVGQLDYFVGKCFDQDADGRLTTAERQRANQALENGFLEKFVRGLDSTGQVGPMFWAQSFFQVHKVGPARVPKGPEVRSGVMLTKLECFAICQTSKTQHFFNVCRDQAEARGHLWP